MWSIEWHQHLLSEAFLTPMLTTICLYVNQKAQVACNFNCFIKTVGLLRVTGSQQF